MKKFLPLMMVAVLIVSALIAASPTPVNGQSAGLVSSVLSRLEKNKADLKSLRAGISMEKYNSQIGSTERLNGVVLYIPGAGRNASVRLEWHRPNEILSVQDGKYILFKPRLNVAYTGTQGKAPKGPNGIMDMMYMSRQQLETKFQPVKDVREETIDGGVSTIHLTLVPKNASYKYAEIWIDSTGMPVQSKIVEKNDDVTTMRLVSIEKNAKISQDDIKLKLASNVKVIKT